MPTFITFKIWWMEGWDSPTFYDMYKIDIEEMLMNYDNGKQVLLFSYADMETWKQWIWDQTCHEPTKISIQEIKY